MILIAEDICFSYGEAPILQNVSLQAEKGSITCIMGPNGSGKTTLLECLMGSKQVKKGRIIVSGKNISSMKRPELARNISFIPQIHAITFPYTVRDTVLMGRMAYAGLFGYPDAEDQKACDDAMEKTDIIKFSDKAYSSLSGGEIRLVLLARALCQDAKIILMDEPAAYLDFRNEMLFLERVSELVKNENITVLMATHSPDHALMFESEGMPVKAVLMKEGKVSAFGRPSDVITKESVADVFGVDAEIVDVCGSKNMIIKKAIR